MTMDEEESIDQRFCSGVLAVAGKAVTPGSSASNEMTRVA
jgi:hypothetical protein